MRRLPALLLVLSLLLLLLRDGDLVRSADAPMEEKEKTALYAAIEGFVGAAWNGSGLYPDPCGQTPIQGVSCDLFNGTWYPTVISIGPVLDNSLQCSPDVAKFSSHLFDLKHLKRLSIYHCFPATNPTPIPATTTASWDNLETLELRSNPGLAGAIPASFGRLSNLQSLVLVDNSNLTGAIPAELGALLKLRRLVLSGNALSGPIPSSLGGLKSLLKMDLSSNLLQGSIPPELAAIDTLTLLDLRNNSLTGGLFAMQRMTSSLQDLLLSNNPLLGGTLMRSGWEKMENLVTLDLSNTGLVGTIPESMAGLSRLRFLALDHNRLTGAVPVDKLAALPNIGAMYLNGNNLTGTLRFSPGFYRRLGSRFAARDNPGLCYDSSADDAHAPSGVAACSEDKVDDERKPEASSTSVVYRSSAAMANNGFFWWYLVLVQVMAATLLL